MTDALIEIYRNARDIQRATSGADHQYWLGKQNGIIEAISAISGKSWVNVSVILEREANK